MNVHAHTGTDTYCFMLFYFMCLCIYVVCQSRKPGHAAVCWAAPCWKVPRPRQVDHFHVRFFCFSKVPRSNDRRCFVGVVIMFLKHLGANKSRQWHEAAFGRPGEPSSTKGWGVRAEAPSPSLTRPMGAGSLQPVCGMFLGWPGVPNMYRMICEAYLWLTQIQWIDFSGSW